MSRLRKNLSTFVIVLVGLVGLGMLLYPTVSDWWNTMHQSYAIASYEHAVAEMDTSKQDRMLAEAEAYNAKLAQTGQLWSMTDAQKKQYESILDVTGTGIMGYVDIPKINITLPIYHDTRDSILQIAIGHLAGTSFPVGGTGSHCCITGHRGLPSARLFTDLDLMETGDLFTVTVLDRTLTYEVDQIHIVLPAELDDLAIDPKQDYLTLITCTPYGVNSHRLLVRGHRVDNVPGAYTILADAVQIKPYLVASIMAIPVLLIALVWVMIATGKRARRRKDLRNTEERFRLRRSRRKVTNESSGEGDES
ncbi:MAG: class C sortase [Atopobiaceae bacterium]|nr:class C sortase [Atopobiaceae bacterium]